MAKIIIENVPEKVINEVENYLQAVIHNDMPFMLQNGGFSKKEHMSHEWNLYSQSDKPHKQ